MVTAELALATPAIAGVAVTLAWLLSLGLASGQLAQAAREGARAAARGDSMSQVSAAVSRVAPHASVSMIRSGSQVQVALVEVRNPPLGMLAPLRRTLRASAVAAREPR